MSDTMPEAAAADQTDRELAQAQLATADDSALAGTKEDIKTGVVDFKGEKFHVAEKIGAMALIAWGKAADLDESGNEALIAVYDMLEDVIHEDEFKRFKRVALKSKADMEELMNLLSAAMEMVSGNPTEQQDGSASS
jgi:hypothetical protein